MMIDGLNDSFIRSFDSKVFVRQSVGPWWQIIDLTKDLFTFISNNE